jgi:uncharacterized protein YjbI with pentapeptide repeats
VQAALTVIGRLPRDEDQFRLDFYNCGLNDARLAYGDFREAMFYYSRLVGALFAGAQLDGAGLSFCIAERAGFNHSSARQASFVNAEYKNGWFLDADLSEADFYGCDLTGSDFGRRYAEEGNPPIPAATLENARFTKAILKDTNLRGVNLENVSGLTREQLKDAITDKNTIMPKRWGGGEDTFD